MLLDSSVQLFFAVFPVLILMLVMRTELVTVSAQRDEHDVATPNLTNKHAALVGAILVVAIPLSLMAYSKGAVSWLAITFAFTAIGACYGSYLVLGKAGAAFALITALSCLFIQNTVTAVIANALTFLVAFAVASVLGQALGRRQIIVFLAFFVVFDFWIVSQSLTSSAVDSLMLFPGWLGGQDLSSWIHHVSANIPVFNRITIADQVLGAIDIAYAFLVAAVIKSYRPTRGQLVITAITMFSAQAAMVWWVFSHESVFPATAPLMLALAISMLLHRFGIRQDACPHSTN